MSTEPCNCRLGLGNTGNNVNCKPLFAVARRVIIVNAFDSTGARTVIPAGTTVDSAFVTGKLNEPLTQNRWFPSPLLDNVEHVREDSTFFTTNNGNNIFIRRGVKPFIGLQVLGTPVFLNQFTGYRCSNIAAYVVDTNGTLRGQDDGANGLFPIRINNGSWDSGYIEATDDATEMNRFKFEWAQSETDEKLRQFTTDVVTTDLLDIDGLLDVITAVTTPVTLITFSVSAKTIFGTEISGLITSDWILLNLTTPATIVITSATENPVGSGIYDFIFPTEPAAQTLELSGLKDGFDFEKSKETVLITA